MRCAITCLLLLSRSTGSPSGRGQKRAADEMDPEEVQQDSRSTTGQLDQITDNDMLDFISDWTSPLVGMDSFRPGYEAFSHDQVIEVIANEQRETTDQMGFSRARIDPKMWYSSKEVLPHWMGVSRVRFGMELYKQSISRVYILGNDSVIKYGLFCPSSDDPIEPLLVEAFFLEYIARVIPGVRVSNRVMFFSRGSTVIDLKKQLFFPRGKGKLDIRRNECDNSSAVPIVRYLITERVGSSLLDFFRSFRNSTERSIFRYALEIGIKVFDLLETIHTHNIVHGDIHGGNIAWDKSHPGDRLLLIDFGRARIINPVVDAKSVPPMYDWRRSTNAADYPFCHGYFTPWTMFGIQTSFRDDAFRALMMISSFIHGLKLISVQESLCEDEDINHRRAYYWIKNIANIFDFQINLTNDSSINSINYLFNDALQTAGLTIFSSQIHKLLGRATTSVRKLSPFEKPDYEGIRGVFRSILDLGRSGA